MATKLLANTEQPSHGPDNEPRLEVGCGEDVFGTGSRGDSRRDSFGKEGKRIGGNVVEGVG